MKIWGKNTYHAAEKEIGTTALESNLAKYVNFADTPFEKVPFYVSDPGKFLHMCTTKLVFDGCLLTHCNNETCKASEKWTNQLKG